MNENIYLIGNAHLDPIWLWRWQEGCGEVLQTFRSALDRLNEYPEFVFTCSSAAYYRWVEEIDPDMFGEIVNMVKKGRWVPVNGWWVQPDCNIPCGESFARQALYSQLYYYEKFGRICHVGYNVDSFGHNGMLPQLLRMGGMSTYVMMRPSMSENANIPENAFWWQSADGSRVLTFRIPYGYGESGKRSIERSLDLLNERCEQTGYGTMLFYGVGNHGGGPTKADIELLLEHKKSGTPLALEFASPEDYFDDLLNTRVDLPVWSDDLQHHASGCYSATSLVKQLNRKAENLLINAEKWDSISALVASGKPTTASFAEAWKDVCFNQFHDILCGCSIMEAYEDVKESMGHACTIGSRAINNALLRLTGKIDTWVDGVSDAVDVSAVRHHSAPRNIPRPIVVFNPLSRAVSVPVSTYHPSCAATDSNGKPVAFQNIRSSRSNDSHLDTLFMAEVPALGYATYWLQHLDDDEAELPEPENSVSSGDGDVLFIENEYIRAEFDRATGGISKLINKENGINYASDGFAVPTVIDDSKTDTWAHRVFTFHDIKGLMELESIELAEAGPVRAVMRIKHRFGESHLSQDFILAIGQRTLRVKCKAFWQEKFTMLKIPFSMSGEDEISTYEIPCGFIKRPCNGEEEPSQNWADLTVTDCGRRLGISVMSDSKYSYDCPGKELRLTCLRNVIFADHFSHRPPADFNFTDEGLQRFEYGIYLHEGEAENSDIVFEAAQFNNTPIAVPESYHKGSGEPQVKSFLQINRDNILLTALKFCEDNSGDAVIRLYETSGRDTKATVCCEPLNAAFYVDFRAHEIKTFRIDRDGFATEVNFLEGIVRE